MRGGGGLRSAEANDPKVYDALIRYFQGELTKQQLESYLPQYGPSVTTPSRLLSNTELRAFVEPTSYDYRQAFRTGSTTVPGSGRWAITSVQIAFSFQTPNPATLPTFEVGILSGSTTLDTFSLSGTLAHGLNTFVADGSDPVYLDPDTQYALVVNVLTQSSGSGGDVGLFVNHSTAKDESVATSWSIMSSAELRQFQSTGGYSTSLGTLKFVIAGHAAEIAPASRTLSQWGDNYAQATYECGGKPNPRIEAFYKDPLGFNWNSGETLYCDLSTGQWVPGRWPQAGVDYARDDQLIAPGASGYNEACYFTDAEGNRTPQARSVTNADGSWARRSDGSRIFIITEGAHWDPIAQQCVQRSR